MQSESFFVMYSRGHEGSETVSSDFACAMLPADKQRSSHFEARRWPFLLRDPAVVPEDNHGPHILLLEVSSPEATHFVA